MNSLSYYHIEEKEGWVDFDCVCYRGMWAAYLALYKPEPTRYCRINLAWATWLELPALRVALARGFKVRLYDESVTELLPLNETWPIRVYDYQTWEFRGSGSPVATVGLWKGQAGVLLKTSYEQLEKSFWETPHEFTREVSPRAYLTSRYKGLLVGVKEQLAGFEYPPPYDWLPATLGGRVLPWLERSYPWVKGTTPWELAATNTHSLLWQAGAALALQVTGRLSGTIADKTPAVLLQAQGASYVCLLAVASRGVLLTPTGLQRIRGDDLETLEV